MTRRCSFPSNTKSCMSAEVVIEQKASLKKSYLNNVLLTLRVRRSVCFILYFGFRLSLPAAPNDIRVKFIYDWRPPTLSGINLVSDAHNKKKLNDIIIRGEPRTVTDTPTIFNKYFRTLRLF